MLVILRSNAQVNDLTSHGFQTTEDASKVDLRSHGSELLETWHSSFAIHFQAAADFRICLLQTLLDLLSICSNRRNMVVDMRGQRPRPPIYACGQ